MVVHVQVKHLIMYDYPRKKILLLQVWKFGHLLIRTNSIFSILFLMNTETVSLCICIYRIIYRKRKKKYLARSFPSENTFYIIAINRNTFTKEKKRSGVWFFCLFDIVSMFVRLEQ